MKFNINDNVIIYPSESGWEQLITIYSETYHNTYIDAKKQIEDCRVGDGFECQLWVLMSVYGDMFFNGSVYIKNSDIDLGNKVKMTTQEIRNLKIGEITK